MRKLVLFLAVLYLSDPIPAYSADLNIHLTLDPESMQGRVHSRDPSIKDWTIQPDIAPNLFDNRRELEFENTDGYEYPRMVIVNNALQSGTYDVLVGFLSGSATNSHWNTLVNDRRVLKFDYGTNAGLFQYLALSNFELRKRTVSIHEGHELIVSGRGVDVKTAQIAYHHLRFWVHVSSIDSFVAAPSKQRLNQVITLLDEFSSMPDRDEGWYKRNTGIARKDFRDVIKQTRALPAAYYQQEFEGIVQIDDCTQQISLIDRLINSFKILPREEQSFVAANFNNSGASPSPKPIIWLQNMDKAKADRAARKRLGASCRQI